MFTLIYTPPPTGVGMLSLFKRLFAPKRRTKANPMYAHFGLQAWIDISSSVSLGTPNGPFDTQDVFGTGKQKSLIIFNLTMTNFLQFGIC